MQNKVNGQDDLFFEFLARVAELASGSRPIYLVGGAVRDHLIDRPIYDWDFVMEGDVRPVSKKIANFFQGAYYLLDDERNIARDIITYRGEKMVLDFSESRADSLRGDLEKRDFTVNAMAIDVREPQKLIDPLAGNADLMSKMLRYCHPESIKMDPVRILRGIRLSLKMGLRIEEKTFAAMLESIPALPVVSMERKRDEIFKMFDLGLAKKGFEMLDEMGILQILLPELLMLKVIKQGAPHVFDVWEHTLFTMDHLDTLLGLFFSPPPGKGGELYDLKPLLKFRNELAAHFQNEITSGRSRRGLLLFSALLHDIGKPGSQSEDESGRIRFLGHDRLGSELAEKVAARWVLSNEEVGYIKQIVGQHMRVHALSDLSQALDRRVVHRFFRDNHEAGVDICILSLADSLATYDGNVPPDLWTKQLDICSQLLESWFEKKNEVITPPRLLSGEEIINILHLKPGPLVGKVIMALREAQGAGEVLTVEDAVNYIRGWFDEQAEGEPYDDISSNRNGL